MLLLYTATAPVVVVVYNNVQNVVPGYVVVYDSNVRFVRQQRMPYATLAHRRMLHVTARQRTTTLYLV